MKVLVTGATGQLGTALQASAPVGVELVATSRATLDICDSEAVLSRLRAERPHTIINCAAFTAVDLAESQTDEASAVNAAGAANVCRAAAQCGARVVHVSTDYVFDGRLLNPHSLLSTRYSVRQLLKRHD